MEQPQATQQWRSYRFPLTVSDDVDRPLKDGSEFSARTLYSFSCCPNGNRTMEEEKHSGPQEPGVIKAAAVIVSHPPFPWHRSDEMATLLLIQAGITSLPGYVLCNLHWWKFFAQLL